MDTLKISMPIHSFKMDSNYGNSIGILSLVVDAGIFFPYKGKDIDHDGRLIFLVDKSGNTFYSNIENADIYQNALPRDSEEKSGTFTFNNENYIYSKEDLPNLDGKVYSITPNSELLQSYRNIRFISLCMVIATMLIMAVLFLIVHRNITLPVNIFMKFISNVKSNNLFHNKQRINVNGYMEINIMAEHFNTMLDEIDILANDLVEAKTRLYIEEINNKEAELALLRSQINPHFLYNTLESMKAIAEIRDVPEIVQMSTSLGRTLRYSINGGDTTTVKSEIDMINDYLQI